MTLESFHCVVFGRVQGVWFRASTKDQARELYLGGWVKNRLDGAVEVYACGESHNLETLKQWLQKGPPLAKVTKVEYLVSEEVIFERFEVK